MVGDVAGHDPGRQRAVRPDDHLLAEADVRLAVERGEREADRAAVAEPTEAPGPPAARPDRAVARELLPAPRDDIRRPSHRRSVAASLRGSGVRAFSPWAGSSCGRARRSCRPHPARRARARSRSRRARAASSSRDSSTRSRSPRRRDRLAGGAEVVERDRGAVGVHDRRVQVARRERRPRRCLPLRRPPAGADPRSDDRSGVDVDAVHAVDGRRRSRARPRRGRPPHPAPVRASGRAAAAPAAASRRGRRSAAARRRRTGPSNRRCPDPPSTATNEFSCWSTIVASRNASVSAS